MALQLNLLHEEISAQRQRQRDPLKLGVIALSVIGALLFLYYMWAAYQTIHLKSRLHGVEAEWEKVEPKVTAAQNRAKELGKIIDSTKVLDAIIEGRFYWAPFLAKLSHCVAPNVQLISLDAALVEASNTVTVMIEGTGAAREPRAAAEEFRQLLVEKLGESYSEVKVEFKNLEDLDTVVNVGGVAMPSARFIVNVSFNPKSPAPAAKTGAPAKESAKTE
jgi:hypothetical protein